MSKWCNKQKVIGIAQQPSLKRREFYNLFVSVVRCFRMCGLCPVKISYIKDGPKIEPNRLLTAIMIVVLISFWASLIASFFIQYNTPLITGIANHIQFITNILAVSVTLGVPIFKCSELNKILDDFIVVDERLSYFNMDLHHSTLKNSFWRCYMAHVLYLIISSIYDGYVMLVLEHDTQFWLWFFHLIPFMLYSLAYMMAFTMIEWVKVRIQQLNRLIEQYYQNSTLNKPTNELKNLTIEGGNVAGNTELLISNHILPLVSKTIDLATRLESYYGLLFLFGYLALFCATTIQLYYCYFFLTLGNIDVGFSINLFVLSLLIILGNLVAILALPYICEEVGNESKTLMSYLSKLSIQHGQHMNSSIWFPSLISSIKFSAMGFFDISYSMLSGFFAGLITYLIIFIQFSSISPIELGTRMTIRTPPQRNND